MSRLEWNARSESKGNSLKAYSTELMLSVEIRANCRSYLGIIRDIGDHWNFPCVKKQSWAQRYGRNVADW